MDDWNLIVVQLGSITALTALVTIIARHRFRGSITITVATILGIFAGVAGASHGPGEILQGDIAPSGIIIEAWPSLTLLSGEPAMTLIPNFRVSGILTVFSGLAVTIWAATRIRSKNGGLVLIRTLNTDVSCRWRSNSTGVWSRCWNYRCASHEKDLKPHIIKYNACRVDPFICRNQILLNPSSFKLLASTTNEMAVCIKLAMS